VVIALSSSVEPTHCGWRCGRGLTSSWRWCLVVHGNRTAVDQGTESHMSKQVKPNLERSHEAFAADFTLLFDSHGPWPLDYERIVAHIRMG